MRKGNKRKYFPGPRDKQESGPETFATCKAWSNSGTLSGLSMKSSLNLGMSIPNTMRHSGHKIPPNHGQMCGYEGTLLPGHWYLPAASTKITSCPLHAADFQHPPKGVQGGNQK